MGPSRSPSTSHRIRNAAVGLMLTIAGAYLGYLATCALSWRQVPADATQVRGSWMCIVPGVTCVIVGGLILRQLSKGKIG